MKSDNFKQFFTWIVGIGVFLLMTGCLTPTQTHTENDLKAEDFNSCTSDRDCILVDANPCGGNTSINSIHVNEWENFLDAQRKKYSDVVCAPSMPRDWFESKCSFETCKVLSRSERTWLGISEPPILSKPVVLMFNFRLAEDTKNVHARVDFVPEGIEIIDGSSEWQGDLIAGTDQLIELNIRTIQPGYYQIHGVVTFERNGQKISMGDPVYIEVDPTGVIFNSQPQNYWPGSNLAYPVDDDLGLIKSELIVDPEPALGKEFTLTYRVQPDINLTNEQVFMQIGFPRGMKTISASQEEENPFPGLEILQIIFPPDGEVFPESLAWRGAILRGQIVEIKAVFKVIREGQGLFFGSLNVQAGGETDRSILDSVITEIHVNKYRGFTLETIR